MEPAYAIVLYEQPNQQNEHLKTIYAESHKIINREVQAGIPFDRSQLTKLFLNADIKFDFGFTVTILPKKVVHLSFNNGEFKVAWTKPEGRAKIMYSENRLNAIVWHPRRLFVSNGISLEVYVLPPGRITDKTQVYYAPYDNLGSGSLCFGTVPRPKSIRDLSQFMRESERVFTFGEFSHSTYLKFWKQHAAKNSKVDVLKLKKNVTIEELF